MLKRIVSTFSFWLPVSLLSAQTRPLPVIDMHLHAEHIKKGAAPLCIGAPFRDLGIHDPKNDYREVFQDALTTNAWADHSLCSPGSSDSLRILTIIAMRKNNVYGVTSGDIETVRNWKKEAPDRVIPSVYWDFNSALNRGLTVDSLEKIFQSGEFKVFGEISIQYEGYAASDSAFDPYLSMAERLDIPVGIHIGCGPPGAPYLNTRNYRAKLHSPFVLEEALIRHPRLRVYAMHAGWPMLDDMIAMLYTHPQLYVDLAGICFMIPKNELYFYLHRLVNAGFGKRIMFGSDNMIWPGAIEAGIQRITEADFLTNDQKRDILFNNAARFLRLTEEQIKQMP
ncbi:MAG: amidohydrolase family protein [Chitinophagaceae bacterium]|nr:amidohydrolase family protein [Chitinophagaceae bacterium]